MQHPAFTLGALCAFGGTMGYVKTGSVPSIVAGVGVGSLYLYAGYLMKDNRNYGIEAALLASTILGASSIPRAYRSQKPLPIGLSVMAVIGFLYYAKKYREFH